LRDGKLQKDSINEKKRSARETLATLPAADTY